MANLVGIGSVLSHIDPCFEGAVWSSGAIREGEQCDLLRAKVYALRGRLSLAQTAVGNPQSVCLGDGGLLAHLLYRGTAKRYAIGFVPHYAQQNDPLVRAIGLRDDVRLIDICGDPHTMFDEIGQCEYILSSSLHGLILADSLGIPNRWVEFPSSDRCIVGGRFKFRDYYSVFGLDDVSPLCLSSVDSLDTLSELIGEYNRPGIENIKQSLLQSFREVTTPYSQLPWDLTSQPIADRVDDIRARLLASGVCKQIDVGPHETIVDGQTQELPEEPSQTPDMTGASLEQTIHFFVACLDVLAECHQYGVAHGSLCEGNISLQAGLPVLQRFGWRPASPAESGSFAARFSDYCRDDLFALGKMMSRMASQWAPCRVVAELLTHPDEQARLTDLRQARVLLAAGLPRPAAERSHAESPEPLLDHTAPAKLMQFLILQNEQLVHQRKLNQETLAVNRMLEIRLAGLELRERAPSSHAVIVIDEEQWRTDLAEGIPTIPFPARDGQYWGLPADDESAIAELESMRLPDERFLAIFQPSFWWLDHYRSFSDHLHATSRVVFKSERLWLFELLGAVSDVRHKTGDLHNELAARE